MYAVIEEPKRKLYEVVGRRGWDGKNKGEQFEAVELAHEEALIWGGHLRVVKVLEDKPATVRQEPKKKE